MYNSFATLPDPVWMKGPDPQPPADWQELLAYAFCDLREASRDPQQATFHAQRLEILESAEQAIAVAKRQIKELL